MYGAMAGRTRTMSEHSTARHQGRQARSPRLGAESRVRILSGLNQPKIEHGSYAVRRDNDMIEQC